VKAGLQARRKHHDAILAALPMTHDDRLVGKVDVLDAELQSLVDPHAGPVEQASEQAVLAVQPGHDSGDLVQTQYNGQASLNPWTPDVLQPQQVETQNLAVQEQQRGQSLFVRRRRDLTCVGQPRQKRLDLLCPEIARVAQFVESDEQANPVDVDVFGSWAVVQISDALPDLVKQLHRDERRQHKGGLRPDPESCDPAVQRGHRICREHELLREAKTHPNRVESM
jgi:hypothetical protein